MRTAWIATPAVLLFTAGCGAERPVASQQPAGLGPHIDNPYLPLTPGSRWVYRHGRERIVVRVTHRTRRVNGVEARVVRDIVREDGRLVEDTEDWYAQDRAGTVWYLGEATTEFEDGRPVTTAGSWETGVDGARPGIAMPARPRVGQRYAQENRPGDAEDRARVLSRDEQAQVPAGHYKGLLLTRDDTPLEPKVLEYKLYARGIGLVLALHVSGDRGREELVRFSAAGASAAGPARARR
jgi:hypothetical protein